MASEWMTPLWDDFITTAKDSVFDLHFPGSHNVFQNRVHGKRGHRPP
jgi:hypothetical protein